MLLIPELDVDHSLNITNTMLNYTHENDIVLVWLRDNSYLFEGSEVSMRYLLIEACHVHVIIHLHLKFCRDRWSDRTDTT